MRILSEALCFRIAWPPVADHLSLNDLSKCKEITPGADSAEKMEYVYDNVWHENIVYVKNI